MRGLVTALRTLTLLPVPGKDAARFSSALYWFPAVGLLLGALQATLSGVIMLFLGWEEFAAAAVLLAGIVLTRGIHADGFADVADGFFGGNSREERLRIMKDSAVGSFGATALMLLFLFKWVVLVKLLGLGLYSWIVAGVILARLAQVLLASSLSYARDEGGTASGFVEDAGARHIAVALLLAAGVVFFLFHFMFLPAAFAFLAAALAAGCMAMLASRKIGGVTGDVLGASSEITELLVWMTGALLVCVS